MKAVIITPCLKNKIKDTVRIDENDFVICADNSFPLAMAENIHIDLIIGDFDTGEKRIFPDGVQVMHYPVEKDDADTMLCVKEAAKRGFDTITVVGGLSGRLDHTFANVQMLAYGKEHGLSINVTDGENEIFLLDAGKTRIEKRSGFSLSVFSYGEEAENITLSGVKYPLRGGRLTNLFPLGLSNEITEDFAEISFQSGRILIILSKLN